MATTQPSSESAVTTVPSLKDDKIDHILLHLPSSASLARAALAYKRWRRVVSSPDFLRRLSGRHASSSSSAPLLGIICPSDSNGMWGLPCFHPAGSLVRSDPNLAAVVCGGDFSLTRVEDDPLWLLPDCLLGLLLLSRGASLTIYDPVSHRRVTVRRPQDDPFRHAYIEDCLVDRGRGSTASFRIVSLQHRRTMRTVEYDSSTLQWRLYPWTTDILTPPQGHAMHAGAAGLLFWKYGRTVTLVLDTSTRKFSTHPLPVTLPPAATYAIGETGDGACCLVCLDGLEDPHLQLRQQVWLLKKNGGGGGGEYIGTWEFEKAILLSEVLDTKKQDEASSSSSRKRQSRNETPSGKEKAMLESSATSSSKESSMKEEICLGDRLGQPS